MWQVGVARAGRQKRTTSPAACITWQVGCWGLQGRQHPLVKMVRWAHSKQMALTTPQVQQRGTGASEQKPGKCQGVQWQAWTTGSTVKVLDGDQQQSWAVLSWMQCVVQVWGTLVAGFSQWCAAGRQQPPVQLNAWHLPSMVLQSLSDPSPSTALLASLPVTFQLFTHHPYKEDLQGPRKELTSRTEALPHLHHKLPHFSTLAAVAHNMLPPSALLLSKGGSQPHREQSKTQEETADCAG